MVLPGRDADRPYRSVRGLRQQGNNLAGGRHYVLSLRGNRPGLLRSEICRGERALLRKLPFPILPSGGRGMKRKCQGEQS